MPFSDSTISIGSSNGIVPIGSSGDILVAFLWDLSGAPVGWTQRGDSRVNAGLAVRVFTKTRAAEVNGATLAFTGSIDFPVVAVANLTGVTEAPVILANQAVSTTLTGLSVSPSTNATFCFYALGPDSTLSGTPSGMTLRENSGTDLQIWTSEVSSGATGNRTVSCSPSSTWCTFTAAFEYSAVASGVVVFGLKA